MKHEAPTDIVDIVIGETGKRSALRVHGDAKDAIVLVGTNGGAAAHFACDPATGATTSVPADIATPTPLEELSVGGTRLYVRTRGKLRELARCHPDGWIEVLHDLDKESRVVWTDRYAFTLQRATVELSNESALFAVIVGRVGSIVQVRLPTWVVTDAKKAFDLVALPHARAVVIATDTRVVWLTYDAIEKLHRIAPRMVKLRALVPGATGEGEVTVTRGGKSGAVVEGADGKRVMINKQLAPVATGDRLTVTTIKGVYALVNATGTTIAREDKIEMVRTVDRRAAAFPHFDTRLTAAPSPGAAVIDQVSASVRKRLHRLAALGLAPKLDERAIDDAAIALHKGDDYVPPRAAIAAAGLLFTHLGTHRLPKERALIGDDAVDAASLGNKQLADANASRRWHLVMTTRHQPLALCLEPAEHATIVDEQLLFLEPVPLWRALPDTVEAARAELLTLLEIGESDLACKRKGARVELRFSARGAAWLDDQLRHPDD